MRGGILGTTTIGGGTTGISVGVGGLLGGDTQPISTKLRARGSKYFMDTEIQKIAL
jgi:hypothetical protein